MNGNHKRISIFIISSFLLTGMFITDVATAMDNPNNHQQQQWDLNNDEFMRTYLLDQQPSAPSYTQQQPPNYNYPQQQLQYQQPSTSNYPQQLQHQQPPTYNYPQQLQHQQPPTYNYPQQLQHQQPSTSNYPQQLQHQQPPTYNYPQQLQHQLKPAGRITKEERKALINEYHDANKNGNKISRRDFAAQKGIKPGTFNGWVWSEKKQTGMPLIKPAGRITEEWRKELVNEFLDANKNGNKISQRGFAAQKGINHNTVKNWVRSEKEQAGMPLIKPAGYTEEERKALVNEFLDANKNGNKISQRGFAAQKGIKRNTFNDWVWSEKKQTGMLQQPQGGESLAIPRGQGHRYHRPEEGHRNRGL
ncbi:hypothetical protein [Pasteuria penetrans]|uniref:hypothetical protein n=1 Tax=Pasteuria penetrans TaxID=86005 RepID=UPI000FBA066D|nr:hypothetical protein [Pasteuria penetrans]